ncbi:MAG: hypothetical protein AAF352_09350 [Pseudomonadota bacterium]
MMRETAGWPQKLATKLAFLILPLALGGCVGAAAPLGYMAAATSTLVLTDKTPSDHLAQYITGMDCSLVRQQLEKGAYCKDSSKEVFKREVVCIRSIGRASCYEVQPELTGEIKSGFSGESVSIANTAQTAVGLDVQENEAAQAEQEDTAIEEEEFSPFDALIEG